MLCILSTSCDKEIGKLDFTKNDTQEISFDLKKDREVKFYADMDIEYLKLPLFVFNFEFYKGKQFFVQGGTDPLDCVSLSKGKKIKINGKNRWAFYGKLDGNFIPPEDGNYTFKVTFIKNNQPDLKINKAEIHFVQ